MDRKHYDRIQRAFGRGHRVPPHECVDVPGALYPTVMGLFMEIAKLDPSGEELKIARIWTENGKLRVTNDGDAVGLGDIIADAEAEAEGILMMSDTDWYRRLVARFGDAVPAAEHLQIRPDLHPVVEDLFASLVGYPVRVYSIAERIEGLVVIDARVSDDITAADKTAVYDLLGESQERLNEL